MRVAYLINQYPKISHSFIRREILALEKQGVNILRISLRGWSDELVDENDLLEREKTRYVLRGGVALLMIATMRMALSRPVSFARAFGLAWGMSRGSNRPLPIHLIYLAEACLIARWLSREGVDHLHAHFGTNSAEVAMLVNALGGPTWSFTVHGPEEFDDVRSIGLAEKIKRANFVVAVSSYGRSQLYRLIDYIDWPKVHIVHCGLNAAFTKAMVAPSYARRLICVGRLCAQKGQLLLIEAVHCLAEVGEDFELILAGDGELRADIERLIERYNLQNIVRIRGWISGERVREEILAARALVLPSFAEGLPVVLMEAMALKRPVLSTYIAGIPELVVAGEHGWLVPAGDVKELARALAVCLDAPADQLSRMGEAGRQRVCDRHDSDHAAASLATLFSSAAPQIRSSLVKIVQ